MITDYDFQSFDKRRIEFLCQSLLAFGQKELSEYEKASVFGGALAKIMKRSFKFPYDQKIWEDLTKTRCSDDNLRILVNPVWTSLSFAGETLRTINSSDNKELDLAVACWLTQAATANLAANPCQKEADGLQRLAFSRAYLVEQMAQDLGFENLASKASEIPSSYFKEKIQVGIQTIHKSQNCKLG